MNGYKNEFDFVLELNNKKIRELNPMLYEFIHDIFDNIDDNKSIKSWKNHYKQKTDIFIKIDDVSRRASIKMGCKNSVHTEEITTFVDFLKENNVSEEIICYFLKYHYGDESMNNTGSIRMSADECKEKYADSIKIINKSFSNVNLINKIIDRAVVKGLVFNDKIDVIICGVPNDFIWIKRDDVYKIITLKKNDECSAPHFGPLVCQPLSRCLNHNPKYEYARNYIQLKWYDLFENIVESMYFNNLKQ